ncbi:MAG: hypothetical protein GY859_02480, partial [Desulfobacterales bacterium]|nr:hypothetical protein [Desulfobacterales bacterium]
MIPAIPAIPAIRSIRAPLKRLLSPGPGRGFANGARLLAWDFYGRFKAAMNARKEKPNPNPLHLWENQPPIGKEAYTDPDFYRAHVLEAVLPFWERHGVDHRNGGFITHLDRHGAPYGRPI